LFPKKYALILLTSIAGIFLILDLVRLAHQGVNLFFFKKVVFFFKEKEAHQFSSITLFLVGSLLTFLIFDKTIAITAVIFLIFGDLFAKFFRLQYGRINFIRKSLEGFLAYFGTCLVIGFALMNYLPLSYLMIIVGAFSASLIESFPAGFDDNFAVPLVSAGTMYLITLI
jgi:glycerol-3-phosphate acyltransferase PlsY